jgi:hypothetical protein
MSFSLAVWEGAPPQTDTAALAEFKRLYALHFEIGPTSPPSDKMRKFLAAITERCVLRPAVRSVCPMNHFETTILDDDGVAVVASESALKRRYVDEEFDYDFPKALLEGMRRGELFAWRTGSEGCHRVSVELVTERDFTDEGTVSTPEGVVLIENSDALLVLPYSQFTYGCDNGADFDLRDGLGARTEVPASSYRVRVVRIGEDEDESGGASFRVLLCAAPATNRNVSIEGVPGWD